MNASNRHSGSGSQYLGSDVGPPGASATGSGTVAAIM